MAYNRFLVDLMAKECHDAWCLTVKKFYFDSSRFKKKQLDKYLWSKYEDLPESRKRYYRQKVKESLDSIEPNYQY